MRFGDGLLAPVAGLAGGRGVAKAARIAAVPVAWSRPCGLVPGCCGQRQHTGGGWRGKNRPQSYGPTGASLAASIMCLLTPRPGDAPSGNLDRGQPPRCDVTQLLPLVDAVPPVRGRRGRPRRRPARLYGARAYDSRGALRRPWPGVGRLMVAAWGCAGGWWSGRWGGCTSSAGCGCVTSGLRTSTRHFSLWGVPASVSGAYHFFVRGS